MVSHKVSIGRESNSNFDMSKDNKIIKDSEDKKNAFARGTHRQMTDEEIETAVKKVKEILKEESKKEI